MNRLLSANFARLKKDKAFWLGMALMFVFGIFLVVNGYLVAKKDGYEVPLDNFLFVHMQVIGVLSAVFCSLFVGTEYSDGTIRNKLVIGHNRSAIYFSNFIVCTAAGLLMSLSYTVAVSAVGIPLLGGPRSEMENIFLYSLAAGMMVLAISAVFTLLSMSNQNKAVVAIISVIGIFLLLFAAIDIFSKLNEPEIWDEYVYMDPSGQLVTGAAEPNPNYLRGWKRSAYEFLYDFLPTGQAFQIARMNAKSFWLLPLYSLLVTVASTLGGLFIFHKKDLK